MKSFLILCITTLFCAGLLGCSSVSEVQAPCNYFGTFCGQKIHINH